MANSFNIDTPFYANFDTSADFWSSPNNADPYQIKLPAGKYPVKSIILDDNNMTWYQLDVPASSGVACFVPSVQLDPNDPDSLRAYLDVTTSEEYRNYLNDRRNEIKENSDASSSNAGEASGINAVKNSTVSAQFELVTFDNQLTNNNTSQAFQYYIEKTRTTFGLPPQWHSRADIQFTIPSGNMMIGRVYSQTIYANPTILSLTPGDIEMVTDNDTLLDLLSGNGSITEGNIAAAVGLNGTGESFFRFVDRWEDYIGFLNETNKFLTVALGASTTRNNINGNDGDLFANWLAPSEMFIGGKGNVKYRNIDFADVLGSERIISGNVMHAHWLNFAVTGQITSQDSFSTSTRSTALENLINNSFADTARDLYFMLGGKAASEAAENDVQQVISEATAELGSGFTGILQAAGDILKGGHIEFPQVIDDCTYGKTLSVQLRFVSPYGDIESRYLNVLLPYIILFTLAAPRQMSSKYDVYMYPFVVKASCKGIFACDSGVITRLEVIRGGTQETEWTADGHPTAIDIQLEVTPLHSKLMQSKNDGLMIKNTGLQHYLGSICGVDLTTSTQTIMLETAKMLLSTERSGIIQTGWDNVLRTIDKEVQRRLSIFSSIRSLNIMSE